MSRYDLETALSEFIQNCVGESYASEDHSHDYSDEDHSHDYDGFEDKVAQYLGEGNFRVGTGCSVQRAFEWSVREIIGSFLDGDVHDDGLVRHFLQAILSQARRLPAAQAMPILLKCSSDLGDAIQLQGLPQAATPNDTEPERININA